MCEFKIRKVTEDWEDPPARCEDVAGEVMNFQYLDEGRTGAFIDILGRQVNLESVVVLEVNQFPKRHDIRVLQDPTVSPMLAFLFELKRCRSAGRASPALAERLEALQGVLAREVATLAGE